MLARCAVRVSMGGNNTQEQLNSFLTTLVNIVQDLRHMSSVMI